MTRRELTLQPTKQTVAGAAATIYASYIAAGRVGDDDTATWMRRSIREAVAIADAIDESIHSGRELPTTDEKTVTPPSGGEVPDLAGK